MAAEVTGASAAGRSLVPWSEPSAPRAALLAIPHAGAGAAGFRAWASALPEVAVFAVRLPGRENRIAEEPKSRMEDVVAELTAAVADQEFDAPLALFGQCSGAVIAFELARSLRLGRGQAVARLFVSGQVPPRTIPKELRRTGDGGDVEQRLRELGGVPEVIWNEPELMELILPAAAADFAVLDHYAYIAEQPLECAVTAFVGEEDDLVDRSALAGWGEETNGNFDCRVIAGGHLPDPEALVAEIKLDLESQ